MTLDCLEPNLMKRSHWTPKSVSKSLLCLDFVRVLHTHSCLLLPTDNTSRQADICWELCDVTEIYYQ